MNEIVDVESARRGLLALAYRMLGSVADAEDAVQETYLRWYRLSGAERSAIENPAAWLTRVAGRVCLDLLGSARARREQYVGEWLPEPLPEGSPFSASAVQGDPLDRVTRDESVSMALLVVLESLTPAERVAFVMHDVFAVPFAEIAETVGRSTDAVRQLASQGRRRVQQHRSRLATRAEHDAVVRSFLAAAATGELHALVALLDPDVVLRSDGGGKRSATRRPVLGADRVGRFLLGVPHLTPGIELQPTVMSEGIALLATLEGRSDSVLSFVVADGRIAEIFVMRNPEKLTQW